MPMHATPTVRRGVRAVVALLGAISLVLVSSLWSNADAATTDNAQLSLTGVVDGNNPAGGSDLGVRPGTTVNFTASAAPTQKVKDLANSLGLGGILNSLLGTVSFQVKADFSHLPGGQKNTVLSDNKSKAFHFTHTGTYTFTYEAQSVSVNFLGQKQPPAAIKFDGNALKKAGIELNASNQYVGHIVVSKNPKNGISVQLPTVHVKPKVAGHNLPGVNLPGVTTPKIRTSVPNLHIPTPGKSTSPTSGPGGKSGSGGSPPASNPTQELPVPTRVLANVGNSSSYYGGGSGGFYGDSLGGATTNSVGSGSPFTPSTSATGGTNGKSAAKKAAPTKRAADLAENRAPSAQLPIVLAILAIVALSLVTATYARLFLLRRNSA